MNTHTRLLVHLCAFALLGSVAAAQTPAVEWAGDRLSIQASNVPLRELVEQVARQTGITLSGADRITGSETVDIRNVYLQDGLKTLLHNVNYILTIENGDIRLRVHSMAGDASRSGERLATAPPAPIAPITPPVPPANEIPQPAIAAVADADADPDGDADADVDDAEEERRAIQKELSDLAKVTDTSTDDALEQMITALTSDHTVVRIRALELLAQRGDDDAAVEIASAFSDHEPSVVQAASDLLAKMPGGSVLDVLESQLTPDSASELQLPALRALAMRGELSSIPAVGRAAREGPPDVRELAQRVLKGLEDQAKRASQMNAR